MTKKQFIKFLLNGSYGFSSPITFYDKTKALQITEESLTMNITDIPSTTDINRVEVIDENGRSYVNWKPTNKIELQIQDEGRTLKIFISQKN